MPEPHNKWKPDDRDLTQLESMAGYGLPNHMIAALLGVNKRTIERHAKDEDGPVAVALQRGKAKAAGQVVQTAHKMATSGKCPALTIFWLKSRLGWSDQPIEEDAENKRQKPLSLIKRQA